MKLLSVAGIAVVGSLIWAPPAVAQLRVNPQALAIADFNRRITAYLDLARKATEGLPALKRTDDPAEIASREIALGKAIRVGRAGARPGDIYQPETARILRKIVKRDFRRRSRGGQKLVLDEIPHFRPKVNQTYSGEWALATFPPTLLVELPELPEGLEYRLVSDALILRDVRANIIVDFILDIF